MNENTNYFMRTNFGVSRTGDLIRTVYIGVSEGLTYIAPFIEDLLFTERQNAMPQLLTKTDIAQRWAACNADIAILVAPIGIVETLALPGDIQAVARIHQVVDTRDGIEKVRSLMSARERKRAMQAKEAGFSYDLSHDEIHFYEFYRTMHKPTMNLRYGDRARSVEESKALATLFREGALFRIKKLDEWVAGSVGQIDAVKKTLNSRLIGVKAGDNKYRQDGAQNFVYHSILEWAAAEKSIDKVDFQGCEPFLTKGTFQYKKRFGTIAEIPNNIFGNLRMLIRPKLTTSSVRQFLINNPILGENPAGELVAQYFYDHENSVRKDIPYASPGITGAAYIDLDRNM